MTFDDTNTECDQEIELIQDPAGQIAYPLKFHYIIYLIKSRSN